MSSSDLRGCGFDWTDLRFFFGSFPALIKKAGKKNDQSDKK